MKFTFSWLKDHLDTKLSVYEIADILVNIGLEVESINDRSKELELFSVAYVKKAEKHPNADRLKVCTVETLKGDFQVVCGAPNAKSGMKGIFAPEGSYIPGTKINLKKTKIRGIDSSGMLLSEKELGISNDHEGIIEVDKSYKIGEPFVKIFGLDDPIIEIGITPNRGDCLSVRGIARDLAAAGAGNFKKIDNKDLLKGNFTSSIEWKIKIDKKSSLCPAVAGVYFKNVKNTESPDWLKKRLTSIGLRPISSLVDITNYITFDLGRPLHVFDADKIKGNLVMRLANKNETIKALDGKKYILNEEMVVIADNDQVQAIGGIMGGEGSSCTENTTNVFLEAALFNPSNIAKTGRKIDLQSDARFRFERGVDPYSIEWGINIAKKLIIEICGGEASEVTIAGDYKFKPKIIEYNFDSLKKIGGIDINIETQVNILEKLGFELNVSNKLASIKVPSFRPDIMGSADIVEEVLRIKGYDNIEPKKVQRKSSDKFRPLTPKQIVQYKSKRSIASRGYYEMATWSFMSSKFAKFFNQYENLVKIDNPINSDMDVMRPSIIPNLISSIKKNQARYINNASIFEVGPQYEDYTINGQHIMATGIKYGVENQNSWNETNKNVDFYDIKSDVFSMFLMNNVPLNNLKLDKNAPDWYHPGKSCTIKIGNKVLGFMGELNPSITNIFEIKTNVCAFEIFLNNLEQFNLSSITKKSFNINSLQAVERDFAFILDQSIDSYEVIKSIKKTNKDLIKDIFIFDVYEGKNMPSGKKSIAIKIILQPLKSTFTDKEIENISSEIIKQVHKDTGGEIRK